MNTYMRLKFYFQKLNLFDLCDFIFNLNLVSIIIYKNGFLKPLNYMINESIRRETKTLN
jgi:hypothetical protein